ncbi:MAG TPA: Na+/H+ antiporter [Phycisphaerae bacterium]|nr:Na+/H+ antiporter [Phycisphaerae bacterium]
MHMSPVTITLLLFSLTTALSLGAVRLKIPYPTAMVIAGVLIGAAACFFPKLDYLAIRLDPQILFTAILPPLLYAAAWFTSWKGFRDNLRPIIMLAIGCVLFTTFGIAAIAVAVIPSFTWPLGFLLGAIVSPPDAVAATAVTSRLRIPKRIVTILDGESLVNDASALVIFRFALTAVMGAGFSLSHALLEFPLVAIGGIGVGVAVAAILHEIHRRIEQPLIETAMTLLTPYAAYLLADELHLSGVLSVVTCGIILSRHSSHFFSPTTRITAFSFWNVLTFTLNGLVFILIGLQLPRIIHGLETSVLDASLFAILVCIALIALRFAWVIPATYLSRLIPAVRRKDPIPPFRQTFLISWVGMRGVVSLAAALSLPETLPNGSAFPGRDLILFITFVVILVTLVLQSLTLPQIIRLLNVEVADNDRCDEAEARRRAMFAALDRLETEPPSHATDALRSHYRHRLEHLSECKDHGETADPEALLYRQLMKAERKTIVDLRDKGHISDELLRKLERELDLEESRLPDEEDAPQVH